MLEVRKRAERPGLVSADAADTATVDISPTEYSSRRSQDMLDTTIYARNFTSFTTAAHSCISSLTRD